MHLRLLFQPTMATIFAVRDGLRDAKTGKAPYFFSIFHDPVHRQEILDGGWRAVAKVFILAMILDCIFQLIVFKWIYPVEVVLVAAALAIIPYLLIRGPVNRIARSSPRKSVHRLPVAIVFVLSSQLFWSAAAAQSAPPTDDQAQPSADSAELAKKLSNPISSLISFPLQSNFDSGMGAGSGWRYTLNVQPVIPISLNPNWNLISRTIVPIIHQHNVVGVSTQSGLGDTSQSLFFSPAHSKRFIWGAGPQLLIPTATDDLLGSEKVAIGPTVLVLKQHEAWTYGLLTNHVWSVAGDDSRADINSTFIQPFLSYNTKDAWTYSLNTESSYDWTANHWNVPVHFSVSKLAKFGNHHVSLGGAIRCWATSSPGGPEGCGLRVILTPLVPK